MYIYIYTSKYPYQGRAVVLQSGSGLSLCKLVYWAGGRMRIDFHPPQNSIIKPVLYLKRVSLIPSPKPFRV